MKEVYKETSIKVPRRLGGSCYILVPKFLLGKRVKVTLEWLPDSDSI